MGLPSFGRTLSGRLIAFGLLPTLAAIGAIVAASALDDYAGMRSAEERLLDVSADGAAAEVGIHNERWNDLAAAMAAAQVDGMFGRRKESTAYAKSVASSTPLIIGAYVTYEPNADGQDAESLRAGDLPSGALDAAGRFVPYWYVDSGPGGDGKLKLKPNAEMETLEYYLSPRDGFAKTGKAAPTLTEPYLYEGVLMVSHTYPIVVKGKFVGITGVDRSLDLLSQIARDIRVRLGADVFVVSAGGQFVAATTDAEEGVRESDRLRLHDIGSTPYAPLAARWRTAKVGGEVFQATDPVLREPCMYATCPVKVGGWSVVVRRTEAEAMRSAKATLVRNVAIGLLGLAVICALLLYVIRSVSRSVRASADAADRIARGDLTEPIVESTSQDETGRLLRSMGAMDASLNALVGSVRTACVRLTSTATEISASSAEQASSASDLGAASAQIAAAVKEISATGEELARTMGAVSEGAAKTSDLAGAGRAGLEGMESSMRDLDRATASIGEKLGAIHDRSRSITAVIGTITKVADRTNLLSINSAIEAEKAGSFGRGFLVISEEIRRLADETASATLDIETMVEQMQTAVTTGVAEMDRFSDQVRRGVHDVAAAAAQFAEIIDRVDRGSQSIDQVNDSVQAQAQGARQISEAMTSLSGNVQRSMQSAQELASASADLQSASAVLRDLVARFQLKS